MPGARLMAVIVAGIVLGATPGAAQSTKSGGWRLGGGVGLYRVDDLAGTPVVPSLSLARELGRRAVVGLELAAIANAGYYSLNALAADFDVGILVPRGRFEAAFTAGPSSLLGGDSDGTPYYSAGVHGSVAATFWASDRVGLSARGRFRQWFTSPADQSPSATAGLVIRL